MAQTSSPYSHWSDWGEWFPSLKGFNRGPDLVSYSFHNLFTSCFHPSKGSTVAQTGKYVQRRFLVYLGFPSLKGFNRGPDRYLPPASNKKERKFPSLKGFNRGPDTLPANRRMRDLLGFHPSKGSTVAQTIRTTQIFGLSRRGFHPSKGSTVAQTFTPTATATPSPSFHPSKGSTVAQTHRYERV